MSKPVKIKPCPFCGRKAESHILYGNPQFILIRCVICKASTRPDKTSSKAIKLWNRRK